MYQFLFTNFFKNDLKFTVVSLGEKKEFYEMMMNVMSSPSPINSTDIKDLEDFMNCDKNHLDYIPESIPNKYNLGQISKLLFSQHNDMSQRELILPKFGKPIVNDALDYILYFSNHGMSFSYDSLYIKNFRYHEKELILELLSQCDDIYINFVKKKE